MALKQVDDEDDDSPSVNEKCSRIYHSANSRSQRSFELRYLTCLYRSWTFSLRLI